MSTFSFLRPAEAMANAQDDAPDYKQITGLKGVDADRIPYMITRTKSGNARPPEQPWNAHGHLDKFKIIERVEWARGTDTDAAYGLIRVFYTAGSTDLIGQQDFLCVERPIGQH